MNLVQEEDEDDLDIFKRHCRFLAKVVNVILSPKMTAIDVDFLLDLRLFRNFDVKPGENEEQVENEIDLEDVGIIAKDETMKDIQEALDVSSAWCCHSL